MAFSFLSSCLCGIGRKKSCGACGHQLQDLANFLLDCPTSGNSDAPSLALLLSFLISGPDLGVWLDCWVSAEFLRTPPLGSGQGVLPSNINSDHVAVCYLSGLFLASLSHFLCFQASGTLFSVVSVSAWNQGSCLFFLSRILGLEGRQLAGFFSCLGPSVVISKGRDLRTMPF